MEKLSATKGLSMTGTHGSGHNGVHPQPRRAAPPAPAKSHSHSSSSRLPPEPAPIIQTSNSHVSDDVPPATPPRRATELGTVGSPRRDEKSLPEPPSSPDDYAQSRSRRRGKPLEKARPEGIENVAPAADPTPDDLKEPTFYPIERHLAEPVLFGALLWYLSFSDWLVVSHASKSIRALLYTERELGELALERFLRTVGYARWTFPENEPLSLTAQVCGYIRRHKSRY